MDALKILIANVPDWIKRLDELSGQIDQRQIELARIVEPVESSSPSRTKSVRNKGSTESLKPHDEAPAAEPSTPPADANKPAADAHANGNTGAAADAAADANTSSPSASKPQQNLTSASALQHHTNQVMEVAHAKARATLRKRNKRSDSLVSREGPSVKYRTRSMIIVYYDSYVQSFFEELVKFVSASRNMMRKAKMAAKVAQIKRMAELEMPDPEEDDKVIAAAGATYQRLEVDPTAPIVADPAATKQGDDMIIAVADAPPVKDDAPKLNYVSTRQMRSGMLSRPGYMRSSGRLAYARAAGSRSSMTGSLQPPDVYDELDKGLEYVQSMCEHAAHQFLRDGDCNDEIDNVKRRLAETKEQADREMERIKKEDPEALKASEEPPKTRSFRPHSMRKDISSAGSPAGKDAAPIAVDPVVAAPKADAPIAAAEPMAIEVDEGIDDMEQDNSK